MNSLIILQPQKCEITVLSAVKLPVPGESETNFQSHQRAYSYKMRNDMLQEVSTTRNK